MALLAPKLEDHAMLLVSLSLPDPSSADLKSSLGDGFESALHGFGKPRLAAGTIV